MKGSDPQAVDKYIALLPKPQGDIVRVLRKIVRSAVPQVEERVAWGMPCYFHDGMLCSIMPCKAYVNLLFPKGKQLTDPKGILKGTGKGMRHVGIYTKHDIRTAQFTRWVKQAERLTAARRSGSTSSKRRRG